MEEIIQLTFSYCQRQEWNPSVASDGASIELKRKTDVAEWTSQLVFHPHRPQMAIYSYLPVSTPPQHRHTAFELLHRINEGLILGNFEYLFNSDQIRFKTSADLSGQQLTTAFLLPLFHFNQLGIEQYFTPLLAALQFGMEIEDSLRLNGKPPTAIPRNRRVFQI
ncbi:MAG: hypothetical protein CMK59_12385 [Proteobacteria bacterium]|nr:hypothetical protein [Pseudomonadota bacterium]